MWGYIAFLRRMGWVQTVRRFILVEMSWVYPTEQLGLGLGFLIKIWNHRPISPPTPAILNARPTAVRLDWESEESFLLEKSSPHPNLHWVIRRGDFCFCGNSSWKGTSWTLPLQAWSPSGKNRKAAQTPNLSPAVHNPEVSMRNYDGGREGSLPLWNGGGMGWGSCG